MFGIQLTEFVFFGKQIGLVLTASSALWGIVFLRFSHHEKDEKVCIVYDWIAGKLLLPLFAGVAMGIVGWLWLDNIIPVFAHEGVTLEPTEEQLHVGLQKFFPLFVAWIAYSVLGLLWWMISKKTFLQKLSWFFAGELVLAGVLISFPVWLGEFSREQFFYIGHNAHSIITFGTVLILDFLFLLSRSSVFLQQHIYPKFPTISKVIWIGLGIDFLSAAIVFEDAIDLTPKFFFMQTVIAILIVNGVFLAGPITRRILNSIRQGGTELRGKWLLFGDIAGTISVASWFSITFTDFFQHLSLQYYQFLILYVGLICMLLGGHFLMNMLRPVEKEA